MKGAYNKGTAAGTPTESAAVLIAEYQIESFIPGTGKGNTITKKDVQNFIKTNGIEKPKVLPSSEGE